MVAAHVFSARADLCELLVGLDHARTHSARIGVSPKPIDQQSRSVISMIGTREPSLTPNAGAVTLELTRRRQPQ